MEVIAGLIKQCVDDNASSAMDQEKYAKRYDGLVERYEKQKCKLENLQAEKAECEFKGLVFTFSVGKEITVEL